jgi:Rha family phage regulatory protein
MTTVTILDSKVQYYVEDNQTYFHLTDILKLLRSSDRGHTSFARPIIKEYPEEFTKYKGAAHVSKVGIYKLIKHFRSSNADKLYTQITKVADAALDAGFMDGNNFLSIAPKSEYIAYNKKLGSAVSSKVIAKCFGKRHDNVLHDIDKAVSELQELATENPVIPGHSLQALELNYVFDCVTTADKMGATREYFLSEGLFNLVVLSYTGKKAFQWRTIFINEFLRLRLESQKLLAAPNLIEAVKKATSKLYVLADTKNPGLYKIGITERPIEQRLKELNATVSSSVVCLWESLPCINARHLESELHTFFKYKQVKSEDNVSLSEWFELSESDLRDLQGILKMNFRYQELDICLIK